MVMSDDRWQRNSRADSPLNPHHGRHINPGSATARLGTFLLARYTQESTQSSGLYQPYFISHYSSVDDVPLPLR